MSLKQQRPRGSQFERTENYSNEHCGKSKHLFRWWRYQHSNQLQVFGGSHHQWQLYQWRAQGKYKLKQTSNGTTTTTTDTTTKITTSTTTTTTTMTTTTTVITEPSNRLSKHWYLHVSQHRAIWNDCWGSNDLSYTTNWWSFWYL